MSDRDKIETRIDFKSESFKKYFKNTSWLFTERIIRILVSFVVTVFVVRHLGPGDFGLLSYAISFFFLFSAITVLGLENITVRELVKHPQNRDKLLGSVFLLRLVGGLAAIILIVLTLYISGESTSTSLLIIIISVSAVFQPMGVIDYYFRAEVKVKYSTYVFLISVLTTSALKILLIILEAPLIYFALAYTVEFVVNAMGFLFAYNFNRLKTRNWKFSKSIAVSLLKDSWPLLFAGLVISIYSKIDQIMIRNMLDNKELGFYAAAVRLSEAWYFIPVALTNSLFPAIVNAKKSSEKFYNNRMQKLYDILAWISLAIAIPVSIFSCEIINIIFGQEFYPAAPVLTIYIWAGVAVFLSLATSQYIIIENFSKLSLYRNSAGMIVNVALNFLLIPVYGIIGAALATLISYSFITFSIIFSPRASQQVKFMFKSIFLLTLISYVYDMVRTLLKKKPK